MAPSPCAPEMRRQAPYPNGLQPSDIRRPNRLPSVVLVGMSSSAHRAAPTALLEALQERVLVADGAMGTMLQAHDLSLDDFEGHEGCNEILNVTRPDVVREIHDAYFQTGCDAVETNTFGANLPNLAEYGISDRIFELSVSGARLAREVADGWSTPDRPRWVLGSVGPGTELPTLGHAPYATLRDA